MNQNSDYSDGCNKTNFLKNTPEGMKVTKGQDYWRGERLVSTANQSILNIVTGVTF